MRFGNVTPCPGNSNLCDVSSGLTNIAIDAFDAHPLPGSPAINAGTIDGAPADDFTGRPRRAASPKGKARPDIGAYEW